MDLPPDSAAADRVETAARLRYAIVRINRMLRQHNDGGLTLSQWSALAMIELNGTIRIGELADLEQVSAPTATRLVASLEERGLLVRTPDRDDRRASWVQVSPSGLEKLSWARSNAAAVLTQRLERLDDDAVRRIADVLPLIEQLSAE